MAIIPSMRWLGPWRGSWKRYSLAVGTFAISLSLRFALDSWLTGDSGLILFVPAVAITTLLAGLTPGIVTAALFGVAIWNFFLPFHHSFALTLNGAVGIASYVVAISIILTLVHWLRTVIEQLQREKEHSEALVQREKLLAREFQHRTKNLFSIVLSLANRSLKGDGNIAVARENFLGRLMALSRADGRLMGTLSEKTTLTYLVQSELEAFAGRFEVHGPNIMLDNRTAQDFSLVIHELATNASKYGALTTPTGHICVRWTLIDNGDGLKFTWRERGGPPVKTPQRHGFGTALLNGTVGRSRLEFEPEGLFYEVIASLPDIKSLGITISGDAKASS